MKRTILLAGLFFISLINYEAYAVPAFARKHQTECTTCHSAWPALNKVGRTYKENGYQMSSEDAAGLLGWDKTMPASSIIKSRPYEKSKGSEKTMRFFMKLS